MSQQPPWDPPQPYEPGYASLPPADAGPTNHPPTAHFATQPGGYPVPPDGYPRQPHEPPFPPPPRRSNVPLIAVILAVTLLLCGGTVTAGILVVRNVTERAKEAAKPLTDPTLPALPTDLPDLPTEIPDLPTGLPALPTGIPGLPGSGEKITVEYEVTGDGPAEIVYLGKLGEAPIRVAKAKLPWKIELPMEGATVVSVTAVRGIDSGDISCRATVDGEEVARGTGEGPFATVSCLKVILN